MLINLGEILAEAGKIKKYTPVIESDLFEMDGVKYEYKGDKTFTLTFTNEGEKVINLDYEINVTVVMPCGRCLEPVDVSVSVSGSKELDLKKTDEERMATLDDCNYLDGATFDSEAFVRNEILVDLPMKVLCSDDCKGICNKCGTNLNKGSCDCDTAELDPRMSKILDVFNQFKEV